jgi:hypothetical protein
VGREREMGRLNGIFLADEIDRGINAFVPVLYGIPATALMFCRWA